MDLPGEVESVVRARLAPREAAEYLAMARPSVGFRIRGDRWEHRDPGGSVIGGEPRTVAFRWPTYDGEPMLLLAQIDCAEVAALLGADWPFPTDGYLLFFHDESFAAEPDLEAVDIVILDPLPLAAEAVASLPDFADHDDAAGFDVAGEALVAGMHDELRKLLPSPRHRLLGWCDTQTPRPAGLRPLLQVEAEEGTAWGEVVNVSFWLADADLHDGRLDGVRRSYETA